MMMMMMMFMTITTIIIIMIIIIMWLSSGVLKAETESVITAARGKQNTMLQKYYKQKQITNADLSTGNENIHHIVSTCSKLAKETIHNEI